MKIGFTKALKEVQKATPLIVSIVFGVTIGAVIVGVLLQQVTSGNIEVVAGISTFLTNWTTDVVGFFTSFGSAIGIAMALLVVVIIVILFGKITGMGGGKGDRS